MPSCICGYKKCKKYVRYSGMIAGKCNGTYKNHSKAAKRSHNVTLLPDDYYEKQAKHNAKSNPINNPIKNKVIRAVATARKKAEEQKSLSANIPDYDEGELKRRVLTALEAPLLARALGSATFVYPYTASRDRREEEATTVFKSRKSRTPPLRSRSSSSSPLTDLSPSEIEDLPLRDLSPSEIEGLKPKVFDIFGFNQYASEAINEANMEGFRHTAVARVEALVHIRLWEHEARGWQKVGGDHAAGRPPKDRVVDKSRRVVRIILSTEPLPSNFVWTVDHKKECAQKWSDGA